MRKFMPVVLAVGSVLGLGSSSGRANTEAADLATLLARADASNAEILAARARVEGLKHVPSQMEAYPDPTMSVAFRKLKSFV